MTTKADIELLAKAKYVFIDLMVGDVRRTLDSDILLGSVILSLCAIDTLAAFAADKPKGKPIKRTTGPNFKAFIKRFMDEDYTPIAGKLYGALRGFLIHSYTTRYFLLSDHKPDLHLQKTTLQGKQRQLINVDTFIEDVEKAAKNYVEELARDSFLLNNFRIQSEYAGLISVFNVPVELLTPLLDSY